MLRGVIVADCYLHLQRRVIACFHFGGNVFVRAADRGNREVLFLVAPASRPASVRECAITAGGRRVWFPEDRRHGPHSSVSMSVAYRGLGMGVKQEDRLFSVYF